MKPVNWIIFGGMHDPALTTAFRAVVTAPIPALAHAQLQHPEWRAVTDRLYSSPSSSPSSPPNVPLSPQTAPPVGIIAFSAGVVAAVWYLQHWQQSGGQVAGLIAVDGWGVPLGQHYPSFRLSHDRFTHRSSMLLGGGTLNFYADPAIPHLALWRAPQTVKGWQIDTANGYSVQPTSAIAFLAQAVKALAPPSPC